MCVDQGAQWRSVSPRGQKKQIHCQERMTSIWSAWRAMAISSNQYQSVAISSNQRTYDFQMVGVESDRDSAAHAFGAFHSRVRARTKPKAAARTAHLWGKGARRRDEHLHARNPKPPPAQPTANGPRTSACTTNASPPPKLGACRSVRALGCSQGDGKLVSVSINVNRCQSMTIDGN